MGAVATFDLTAFRQRYPEFANVTPSLVQAYFAEATLYFRNDGTGPVQDAGQQALLLNMLTAHIAALNRLNPDGSSASGLAGPITSATEGSVSVSSGLIVEPGSAQWFQSTTYGFSFWTATAAYRQARYVPGPQRQFVGRGYGWNRGW